MKHLLFLVLALPFSLGAQAQNTYTEKLTQTEAGKGKIVINQSVAIDRAVNGIPEPKLTPTPQPVHKDKPKNTVAGNHHATGKAETHNEARTNNNTHDSQHTGKTYISRARHKAKGFRICIFTGGNSRKDKMKAIEMGNKCRAKFGELAVYPSFIPPRWVTYVGDFKTRQEAQKYVNLIRRAHFTYEVRIVSSEVNVPD